MCFVFPRLFFYHTPPDRGWQEGVKRQKEFIGRSARPKRFAVAIRAGLLATCLPQTGASAEYRFLIDGRKRNKLKQRLHRSKSGTTARAKQKKNSQIQM
jgi:hypothetical protein